MTDFNLFKTGRGNTASATAANNEVPDLVCLSHLRWDFVYQRPQHLLSRCAKDRRVFFIEEPIFDGGPARMDVSQREDGVYVVVPHLSDGMSPVVIEAAQRKLLDDLLSARHIRSFVAWYYTPMALGFSRHLKPLATVYDCMDELALFKGASPLLKERELELFRRADLVFTGGQSLYEAKRLQHANVHAFPSSIDKAHFGQARNVTQDPADQADIPHQRMGFFGVVDERMDIDLLDGIAAARPDWHLVIIGPVVKIDPASLPQRPNIHYLGGKSYKELPKYLAGWDVTLLPFANNESTRFISPTKTPEYLSGGKPVVSTPIRDVIRPYGDQKLVWIAKDAGEFVTSIEAALALNADEPARAEWLGRVDAHLAHNSWDSTWQHMRRLIDGESAVTKRQRSQATTQAADWQQAINPTGSPAGAMRPSVSSGVQAGAE